MLNLRVGIFPKRPKLYISGLKLASCAGSGLKISSIYVVAFQQKGPKSSFSVHYVILSYSILLDL